MDLKSGNFLWLKGARFPKYPKLNKNISCDVVIIGGGIIGALVAYYLSQKKISVVLIDKRTPGKGSTSASTAILMYELDTDLNLLNKMIGPKKAKRAYDLSIQGVRDLKRLIKKLRLSKYYSEKQTLYIASDKSGAQELKKEFAALRKNKYRVDFLDNNELQLKFGINKPAAIQGNDAADIDPVIFTLALLNKAQANGVKMFSRTEFDHQIEHSDKNILTTKSGHTITAKHTVFATGYESVQYLKKGVVDLKSSYVLASKPLRKMNPTWLSNYLIWETARPYLYIRTTPDNRILVGGEDVDFVDAERRDRLIKKKSKALIRKMKKFLPGVKIEIDYEWTGTFGETRDGLGYIGCPKEHKNSYFALGFGGNGITSGIIAAQAVTDLVSGRKPKNMDLFSFNRFRNSKMGEMQAIRRDSAIWAKIQ